MRSPNGKANMLDIQAPMIDNAPSFALFNTSFDSLGEPSKLGMTMSGGLGISASFSFGLGVPSIKSRDEGVQAAGVVTGNPYPQPNNSLRLSGSGSLGGFAPSNSFGDQRPPKNGAKTMVLGGGPSSSLVMDERHAAAIILSGTSSNDGSPGASLGRARSGSSITSPYLGKVEFGPRSVNEFYGVLRSHKKAFEGCIFLLPGLKTTLAETASMEEKEAIPETDKVTPAPDAAASAVTSTPPRSGPSKIRPPRSSGSASPDRGAGDGAAQPKKHLLCTPTRSVKSAYSVNIQPTNEVVAHRRVKSAICAFGGSGYVTEQPKERNISMEDDDDDLKVNADVTEPDSSKSSIFRTKKEEEGKAHQTLERDETADADATFENVEDTRSEARKLYDKKLPDRFYENNDRLSWEIEDEPPIDDEADVSVDGEPDTSSGERNTSSSGTADSNKRSYPGGRGAIYHSDRDGTKMRQTYKQADVGMMMPHHAAMSKGNAALVGSPQPKMRYRCKLCGQPKQNHSCPYQKSLQRSIGTMAYKAVNAFTAEEPGEVAPALSTMNNFVTASGGDKSEPSSAATTPSRGVPKSGTRTVPPRSASRKLAHTTPQSVKTDSGSPGGSSLSTVESPSRGDGGRSPVRSTGRTPRSSGSRHARVGGDGGGRSNTVASRHNRVSLLKKLRFPSGMGSSSSRGGDLLFVESVVLREEQFRVVRPRKASEDAPYNYAALPLPYGQRKRLSDKLFGISKTVPNLTDECAHVLREARQKDMWDTAVAELYTQVLVGLACPSQDERLEGLRWHLLKEHGIAC